MNAVSVNQVFQTSTSSRWQRFKWASRILLLLTILGITVLAITLQRGYTPALPRLKSQQYKKVLDSSQSFVYKNSLIARQYGGFRKFINEQQPYQQGEFRQKKMYPYDKRQNTFGQDGKNDPSFHAFAKFPCGIRSAFYVTWDPQSFYSLQRNISRLNLVIPEWMFIDAKADTLIIRKDQRAYEVM
jgi:hypothetical protein